MNFAKRQASMSDAERQARRRDPRRKENCTCFDAVTTRDGNCYEPVTIRHTDIDIDLDKDKEIDVDIESDDVRNAPTPPRKTTESTNKGYYKRSNNDVT